MSGLATTSNALNSLFSSVGNLGDSYSTGLLRGAQARNFEEDNKREDIKLGIQKKAAETKGLENESKQMEADFKNLNAFYRFHSPRLIDLSITNPSMVDGYIEGLEKTPELKALFKRMGLSDMKAVVEFPGKVGMELPVKATPEMIERLKRTGSGAESLTVKPGDKLLLKVNSNGDMSYELPKKVPKDPSELTPKQEFSMVMDLRKEFNNLQSVKDYASIKSANSRIGSVWNNYSNSPDKKNLQALDQTLVTSFNKMLDPGSVVRESEFARTTQGQALLSQAEGFGEKLLKGGVGLTDKERKTLVDVSNQLLEGQRGIASKIANDYSDEATRAGFEPKRILGNNMDLLEGVPVKQQEPTLKKSKSNDSSKSGIADDFIKLQKRQRQ